MAAKQFGLKWRMHTCHIRTGHLVTFFFWMLQVCESVGLPHPDGKGGMHLVRLRFAAFAKELSAAAIGRGRKKMRRDFTPVSSWIGMPVLETKTFWVAETCWFARRQFWFYGLGKNSGCWSQCQTWQKLRVPMPKLQTTITTQMASNRSECQLSNWAASVTSKNHIVLVSFMAVHHPQTISNFNSSKNGATCSLHGEDRTCNWNSKYCLGF